MPDNGYLSISNNIYKTAYGVNTTLTIVPIEKFTSLIPQGAPPKQPFYYKKNIQIISADGSVKNLDSNGDTVIFNVSGTWQIRYFGTNRYTVHNIVTGNNDPYDSDYSFYFPVSVVENKLPLKRKTVTDVIVRLLEVAEPIFRGERPRFILQGMYAEGVYAEGSQAALFDKIYAPEFSFTKQTLRECLQEIGKFIHGEPRLRIAKAAFDYTAVRSERFSSGIAPLGAGSIYPYGEGRTYYAFVDGKLYDTSFYSEASGGDDDYYIRIDGLPDYSGMATVYEAVAADRYYYEVYFDMYARNEETGIWHVPYTNRGVQHNIESFLTWTDSNAENLVNRLDRLSGVIVEPYASGGKTVRTRQEYSRIEDTNMIIATQYPIFSVEDIEYVYTEGGQIKSVSIRPWLFEASLYNTQLSSYQGTYPYSKAYGIYYTQGERNIQGLNFKQPAAAFAAFKSYAILNIIREALGNPNYSIAETDYPSMAFRVTYTPFYSVRVAQTKQYADGTGKPSALIYNQQANVVESSAYGESLKGVAARLGNVEATRTAIVNKLYNVPKVGQVFKKDYYVTAVAVEILPNEIRCTIGLSKDFNRLSAYIGISSMKRYYQVSQAQAVERNVLYRDYIVIGDEIEPDPIGATLIGSHLLEAVAQTFTQNYRDALGVHLPATSVTARGLTYSGDPLPQVVLPVISSAFGNSISFSWKYEDNYSAGAKATYQNNAQASGYFRDDTPYTDYYGRAYYYEFIIHAYGPELEQDNFGELPYALPAYSGPFENPSVSDYNNKNMYAGMCTAGTKPYILRKDNREILQVNYQVDFVTNRKNMIIGSALAANCPAVRGTDTALRAKLYVLDKPLNKFTNHAEAYGIDISGLTGVDVAVTVSDNYIILDARDFFPASGKAWAIISTQTESGPEEVEDEQGNVLTQKYVKGGDLLLAENVDVVKGNHFPIVYLTCKHNIFDQAVWKDKI